MQVNFYKKPQIKVSNTFSKIENYVLFFSDYLERFISNSAKKKKKSLRIRNIRLGTQYS